MAWAMLRREGLHIYLILNAHWEQLEFELPPIHDSGAGSWRRWIDTALEPIARIRLDAELAPGLRDVLRNPQG